MVLACPIVQIRFIWFILALMTQYPESQWHYVPGVSELTCLWLWSWFFRRCVWFSWNRVLWFGLVSRFSIKVVWLTLCSSSWAAYSAAGTTAIWLWSTRIFCICREGFRIAPLIEYDWFISSTWSSVFCDKSIMSTTFQLQKKWKLSSDNREIGFRFASSENFQESITPFPGSRSRICQKRRLSSTPLNWGVFVEEVDAEALPKFDYVFGNTILQWNSRVRKQSSSSIKWS